MNLSIIIPVYQVENTILSCVRSVQEQSFQDYQLILIDDGSFDNSSILCDQLAKEDKRISVIHQKNQGLSAARNTGLDFANGDYITFIDSDDTIAPDTLFQLMSIMNSHPTYDILEYPVYEHFGYPSNHHLLQFDYKEYDDMQKYWLKGKAYCHTYAWNKIYRRALFDQVRFPVGKTFEDVFILPKLLSQCKKVVTTDVGLYYYNWNPKGITAKAGGKELSDLLDAHLLVLPSIHDTDYFSHVLNIQMDVYELTGEEPVMPILPYRKTYKQKMLHLLGLKRLCKLNKIAHAILKRHL